MVLDMLEEADNRKAVNCPFRALCTKSADRGGSEKARRYVNQLPQEATHNHDNCINGNQ